MKDKITVLCVEDGSVDLEEIENGIQDGKVLVYRQGSQKPYTLELEVKRKPFITEERWREIKEYVEEFTRCSEFAVKILKKMVEIETRGDYD